MVHFFFPAKKGELVFPNANSDTTVELSSCQMAKDIIYRVHVYIEKITARAEAELFLVTFNLRIESCQSSGDSTISSFLSSTKSAIVVLPSVPTGVSRDIGCIAALRILFTLFKGIPISSAISSGEGSLPPA